MKKMKRILIALDLSTMDDNLISYSWWFAKSVKAEKIYFIYCARELREINEYSSKGGEDQPRDEIIREHISKAVQQQRPSEMMEYEIIVDQNNPLEGLLYWKDVKKIDLLIVGKKKSSSGSGIISKQFVRQSDCPVLFVPEGAKMAIHKILVPIDFSENSGYALHQGTYIQPYFGDPEIICMNVFFAAPEKYGLHETDSFTNMRLIATSQKYQQFIAPFTKEGKKIKPYFKPDNDFNTIKIILSKAEELNAGLIIIGAIGHSKIKLLTVGSTAEKMMLSDITVPLLIVKNHPS